MRGSRWWMAAAGVAAVLAAVSGCGPAAKQAEQPLVFYPPPPDAPRLQFLTTINDAEDLQPKGDSFTNFIVGAPKKQDKPTEIRNPYGLAVWDGKLYITDLGRLRIHVIDLVRKSYSTLGAGDEVIKPAGIAIGADGTKYVADAGRKQVIVFDAEDRFVRALGDPKTCARSPWRSGEMSCSWLTPWPAGLTSGRKMGRPGGSFQARATVPISSNGRPG